MKFGNDLLWMGLVGTDLDLGVVKEKGIAGIGETAVDGKSGYGEARERRIQLRNQSEQTMEQRWVAERLDRGLAEVYTRVRNRQRVRGSGHCECCWDLAALGTIDGRMGETEN